MKKVLFFGILLFVGVMSCVNRKNDPVATTTTGDTSTGSTTGTGTGGTGTSSTTLNCGTTTNSTSDSVCFNTQILPMIVSNCATSGCHDAKSKEDGYELTSYSKIIAKGIKVGSPSNSKLYQVMIRTDNERMPLPPLPALSKANIDLFAKWIQQGAKNVTCGTTVDTVNVSYSKTIQPVITTYCLGCHQAPSNSGGVNLSTYSNVKTYVDNKRLYGSITYSNGYIGMPQDNKLTDCQILVFKKWIDAGAKNN